MKGIRYTAEFKAEELKQIIDRGHGDTTYSVDFGGGGMLGLNR